MDHNLPTFVLHWNYRGFTEFPIHKLRGDEHEVTDIYLKDNLISQIPKEIGTLVHLESLYLSGNDITELPSEIAELRFLKCLDLSGNRLRSIPEEVGELRSLKFLILDENELTELPLRIAELRSLRYLSVCDNNLQWLPQRPVYNYYHCEFRFWRNIHLKTIPYSLWYHMFRDQQTRSVNIGCLKFSNSHHTAHGNRCRLKLTLESGEFNFDVECPRQYGTIFDQTTHSPPSLYEICRRKFYQILSDAAKKLSDDTYFNNYNVYDFFEDKQRKVEEVFQDINIEDSNNSTCDLNGNNIKNNVIDISKIVPVRRKSYYVPKDIINDNFEYLPRFIKQDVYKGPVSRCEFASCKTPLFDFVFYEFCIRKIILIDTVQDVILNAAFCSKGCADAWRNVQQNTLSWTLLQQPE